MSYIAREARQELLETVAEAAEDIGAALALVEAAYERLDDRRKARIANLRARVRRILSRAEPGRSVVGPDHILR